MVKLQLSAFVTLAIISSVSTAAQSKGGPNPGHGVDFSQHPYKAPGPNDLRGPCPGLNTLANHGFLPRDGRNISPRDVVKAGLDAYNFQADVLLFPAKLGVTAGPSFDTFTLADIRLHDSIEHDASLSRQDFANGDNFSFNETIFQTLLNSNPSVDFYNGTSAGKVLKDRLDIDRIANPKLQNTVKEFQIRLGESAFYLAAMGNVTAGTAPKKFVQIFFREERLPIAEGWKRSVVPVDRDAISQLSGVIEDNADWTADPGSIPTVTFNFFGNTTVQI